MPFPIGRRSVLAAPALLLANAGSARAAPTSVRFARQFSMGYLQFNVMEKEKLLEKHARAAGLGDVTAEWLTFNGPDAMNGALISNSVDVVSGGIPGLVTLWARTAGTPQEVRGISALSSQPCLLNTRRPEAKTIADLGEGDKIGLPTIKVSIQAVTLQMAAAQRFGPAQFAALDRLTVSMSPPDATIALLNAGITCAFSVPPFQERQVETAGIHTLLNSFDVAGPHSFTLCWANRRFRDGNPALFAALVAALREATERVNADRAAAAMQWIADTRSTLPPELVTHIVAGPQVSWTTTPQGTAKYAAFMAEAGTIKRAPATWQDMFFPEAHGSGGS